MMKKMTKTCAEWNLLCVDINYWNIRINKNMKLKFPVCSHIVLFVATFTLALLLPLFSLWCLSVSVNIRAVYVIHEILYYHIRLWNKSILCCCCFCFSLLFVTGCKERLGFGLFAVTLTWGGVRWSWPTCSCCCMIFMLCLCRKFCSSKRTRSSWVSRLLNITAAIDSSVAAVSLENRRRRRWPTLGLHNKRQINYWTNIRKFILWVINWYKMWHF